VARHPAKYSKGFAKRFAEILVRHDRHSVIDPFAGVGGLVDIRNHGYDGLIFLNELEREWLDMTPLSYHVFLNVGDAASLPFESNAFDSACTSVTYGNRMADHHRARDTSRRNTYTHAIGRDLTPGNTGAMHFGSTRKSRLSYCTKSKRCYVELRRVLADNAIFVLNVSDHIRHGRRMRVTLWHIRCLTSIGFEMIERVDVPTQRNRQGANGDKRVAYESIVVFRLNKRGVSI
jgi:hypothetical protein